MNSLSKFLYFADIVGQITSTLSYVGLALIAVSVVFFAINFLKIGLPTTYKEMVIYVDKQFKYSYENVERRQLLNKLLDYEDNGPKEAVQKYHPRPWLIWGVVLVVFSSLLPSKEAVYLIAGSEAGEAVVTSDTGQEILDDIQEVIKYQLQQLKGL